MSEDQAAADAAAAEAARAAAEAELIAAADAHSVRIAVLEARVAEAETACQAARLDAWPSFAAVRNSNKPQQIATVGGRKLALLTIYAGTPDIRTDEDLMMLCVRPHELETFALPGALDDPRVVKLLDEHFPEFVQRRIKPAVRAELEKELRKHDGQVANRNDGEWEQVATITSRKANGRFQCKLEDNAAEVIAAGVEAGLITEDGEIIGAQLQPADEPEPEPASEPEPAPRALVFRPNDGPAPTDEQAAIVDEYGQGSHLVVNAYAGSGKTTILRMLAGASPSTRVQYVAYNKAAKKAAAGSFPRNATCSTSHSLAFRPMIHMARRIGATKYIRGTELAKLMDIRSPARLTGDRVLAPGQLASVVKATILKFCYSADEQISGYHVPRDMKRFTSPEEIAALQQIIPPLARRVWERDITTVDGKMPMEHDYYLKAFQLTHPQLETDVLALDEAQDSNPCVAKMVLEQAQYGTQIVMVGDTYQAIYGWRGATDAMAGFAADPAVKALSLTQSFRFGPAVAGEGNKWLTLLGAAKELRGYEKIASRIGQVPGHPDAVLCRTNTEAFKRAIDALGHGLKVAFPKGAGELIALTKGAADIKAGRPSEHPDLMAFSNWSQVQDFAENEPGGDDLKLFVDLVDEHGPEELLAILSQIGSTDKGDKADITISTAHGAKGLEWPLVLIAGDFLEPKRDPDAGPGAVPVIPREMAMLAYVAVTRAQYVLDRSGLAWVDRYLPAASQVRAA
jgi:energy-coupling factor transporter ATP-binding protein EcfA2